MTIYNKWGDVVVIKANCGEHKPLKGSYVSNLILATHEDGREAFYFDFTLKADGGFPEIVQSIKDVWKLALPKTSLKKAIEEAS